MNHSEQMNELAVALAAAQSNMKAPKKDREVEVTTRTGSKYKFRYATFDAIVESVRGPLGLGIERDLYFKPTRLVELCPELATRDQEVAS